jgi:hypothetical protein
MGDHQASIKIEAEFHGVKKKCYLWINYWPDSHGIDENIREFFRELHEKGMAVYEEKMAEYWEKEHAEDIRKGEEREFERLKKKLNKA